MTVKELQDITEPLEDSLTVQWGRYDPTIPADLFDLPKSELVYFKAYLNTLENFWEELGVIHEGKLVAIRQWLVGENEITFYLGYSDDEID